MADLAKGEKFTRKCIGCHTFDAGGANKTGPNLYDLVNSDIGSRDFSYSSAMAAFPGNWDYATLNEFLYNPKSYISGTKMSYKGIKKDEDRANLIAYMRTLSAAPVPLP
jgi:cytochrome c